MQNINIKVVTQMTGINENTLRAWERRYALVKPTRSKDGHRLFSIKDVEKLNLIGKLLKQGFQIGNLSKLSFEQLKKLEKNSKQELQYFLPEFQNEFSSPNESYLQAFTEALKKFDLEAIQQSLQKAQFELSPKLIASDLILPLLQRVGDFVSRSELSVAQEHLLSSLVRDYLGGVYQSLTPYERISSAQKEKVVFTTREGDLHEFSILLAAIIFRTHGYQTYYLGPNMPADDLAKAIPQFGAQTLVLGLSILPKEKEKMSVTSYLKKLDSLLSKKVTLIYGGSALPEKKPLLTGRKVLNFNSIQNLDSFLSKV